MKSFYVISALLNDSTPLDKLVRHETEAQAINHAKSIIEKRRNGGAVDIDFYILKVHAKVGTSKPPIKVEKLK